MACYMEHCSTIVQLMNISFFPLRTDVKDEKPDLKRETKDMINLMMRELVLKMLTSEMCDTSLRDLFF